MKIIGITGGVGSGKSTVLNILKSLCNCEIIMADDVAKELMKKGGPITKDAVRLFGENAYKEDNSLNTPFMADKMYRNEALRKEWSSIVHPAVNRHIFELIEKYRNTVGLDFVFIEAALLIENNYDKICDEIWYVYADENERMKRLIDNRGYSEDKVKSIFAAQMSDDMYKSHCGFIIDNSKGVENTRHILQNKLEEYSAI